MKLTFRGNIDVKFRSEHLITESHKVLEKEQARLYDREFGRNSWELSVRFTEMVL